MLSGLLPALGSVCCPPQQVLPVKLISLLPLSITINSLLYGCGAAVCPPAALITVAITCAVRFAASLGVCLLPSLASTSGRIAFPATFVHHNQFSALQLQSSHPLVALITVTITHTVRFAAGLGVCLPPSLASTFGRTDFPTAFVHHS